MKFCLENFTSFYLLLFPSPPPHPVAKNYRLSDNEDSLAFAFPAWNIRHNSQKFTKGAKCFKHNVKECLPVAAPEKTVIGSNKKVLSQIHHYWKTFDTQGIN